MENTTASQEIETSNEFNKLLELIKNSSATSNEKLDIYDALINYITSH
jgi:hypothetical protein